MKTTDISKDLKEPKLASPRSLKVVLVAIYWCALLGNEVLTM